MAEILLKAVDATHPDPEKDRRGCYKRGMPVVVMPDGHPWGKEERPPKFFLLKLPGVSVARVAQFIEHQSQGTDAEGVPVTYRRRLWRLRWEELPTAVRNRISANGGLTIAATGGDYTWTQVRAYLKREDTGATAPATL